MAIDDENDIGQDDVDILDLVDEAVGEDDVLEDKLLGDVGGDLTEKIVEAAAAEANSPGGSYFSPMIVEESYTQPVSRATMVCLRGPCQHHWALTARFAAPGKVIRVKRVRSCTCFLGEETNLGGQNVYHCDRWWPQTHAWMPESLRPVLRGVLAKIYEAWLKVLGYDLSWKTWPDWIFESDHRKFRKHQNVGAPRPDRRDFDLKENR